LRILLVLVVLVVLVAVPTSILRLGDQLWHCLHDHIQEVLGFLGVNHLIARLLSMIILVLLTVHIEVLLVPRQLVLHLAEFFRLIVADGQPLVIDANFLLSHRCIVWGLEADERLCLAARHI